MLVYFKICFECKLLVKNLTRDTNVLRQNVRIFNYPKKLDFYKNAQVLP